MRKNGHFKNYYDYVRLTTAWEGKSPYYTYIWKLYRGSMVRVKLALMIMKIESFFKRIAGVDSPTYVSPNKNQQQ